MPLSILVPMVVIGIAGIAVLLHVLGKTGGRPLTSEDMARAAWLREMPDARIARVHLSRTGRAALIESDAGLGIVWAMGADTAVRMLSGSRAEVRGHTLSLRLKDYDAPRIRLALDGNEAEDWAAKVETGP